MEPPTLRATHSSGARRFHRPIWIFLLLAVALPGITPGEALAKKSAGNTLLVDPLTPGAFSTIQAAVDAAVAGDTVVIADKGTPYTEDVIVTGKDRITILADSGVVLQTGGGSPSAGILRIVNSRRVLVKALHIFCDGRTTRRGFVLNNVVEVTLDSVNAEVCLAGARVEAPSTRAVITNGFFFNDLFGVDVAGGQAALVDRTKASFCGTGIRNAGDNTRIIRATVEDSEGDGVSCTGGLNLFVEQGSFTGNRGAGVTLRDSCKSASVANNTFDCVSRNVQPKFPIPPRPPGVAGVDVRTSGVFTIVDNVAMNCSGTCYALEQNMQVGAITSPGGGYLRGNVAMNCSDQGFLVELSFDGWVLERNIALMNGTGFLVNSSRNAFIRNYASGNSAGFIVDSIQSERRNATNPADNVGIENISLDDIALPLDLQ
jgi:Right handed beta helix region